MKALAALALLPVAYAAPLPDLSAAHTVTLHICAGWRAWRHGPDLVIVCPGHRPPGASIELREYYVVTP